MFGDHLGLCYAGPDSVFGVADDGQGSAQPGPLANYAKNGVDPKIFSMP